MHVPIFKWRIVISIPPTVHLLIWLFLAPSFNTLGYLNATIPHAKSWLVGKDSDAGRDSGQEEMLKLMSIESVMPSNHLILCHPLLLLPLIFPSMGDSLDRNDTTYKCMRESSVTSVIFQPFATVWNVARQAPLSMGFSRQEHWSGLSCPSPGDLPNQEIKPGSPAAPSLQADSLPLSHWGSPILYKVQNSFHCLISLW